VALLPAFPVRWLLVVSGVVGWRQHDIVPLCSLPRVWRASQLLYPLPSAWGLDWGPCLVSSCPPTIAIILGLFLLPHWRMHRLLPYWYVIWVSRHRQQVVCSGSKFFFLAC
jgi:hypothetical protein